jgi:hypothetical protein
MNKQEIREWIRGAIQRDTINEDYDEEDRYWTGIYEKDGKNYAIDFCNPAPDADIKSVGEANFQWVVDTAATYAIEKAQAQQDGKDNLTWGAYLKNGVMGKPLYEK